MGGLGSGWFRARRRTVEESRSITTRDFARGGALGPAPRAEGTLTWRDSWGRVTGSIGWTATLTGPDTARLSLHYAVNDTPVTLRISLTRTHPPRGGPRWYFNCPLNGARCEKLHLPPEQTLFASRQAHRLTYGSTQHNGGHRSAMRHLMGKEGMTREEARALLRGE